MNGRVRPAEDDHTPEEQDRADESTNSSTRAFSAPPKEEERPAARPSKRTYRLRIAIAVVVTLAVLVGAAVAVWALPVFRVAEVTVEGNSQVEADQIIEASSVVEGENLLQVDQVDAARGVVAHPRIREATVSRSLPDTVRIDVVERRVVAWLDQGGEPVLIDDTGVPFVDGEPPRQAVRVEGVTEEDDELLAGAVEVSSSLSEGAADWVEHLRVDGPAEYVLVLTDGRTVNWGAPGDNHNKAIALETVIQRPGETWDISDPTMVTSR